MSQPEIQPAEEAPELSDQEALAALQNLLAANPEEGNEVLSRLMPSADPEWTRNQVDELSASATAGESPDDIFISIPKAIFGSDVEVDEKELQEFCLEFTEALDGRQLSKKEVESCDFQTKEDWRRYAFAKGAIAYHGLGSPVAPPLWRQLPFPARDLSHTLRPEHDPSKAPLRLGLFADFGNGLYAARAIARWLAREKLPYVFHLGDVYHGGTEKEFDDYFRKPLAPMIEHSELFMLAGNHELYAKGIPFQNYIQEKAKNFPGLQRQKGEMFRLIGHGLQLIGIDTMWNDWKGGQPRAWARLGMEEKWVLEQWLSDVAPNTLTVLLTSDHPWDLGSKLKTKFLGDIEPYIKNGQIDLWFWGNVHYASLYQSWQAEGSQKPGFIGSCIGHGGYPYYTQKDNRLPSDVKFAWVETKHRFWPKAKVRPDVGMNGWCEMQVQRESKQWRLKLIYKDWVGRESAIANIIKKDGSAAHFEGGVKEYT